MTSDTSWAPSPEQVKLQAAVDIAAARRNAARARRAAAEASVRREMQELIVAARAELARLERAHDEAAAAIRAEVARRAGGAPT